MKPLSLMIFIIIASMTGCGGLKTKPEFHSAAVEPYTPGISYSPSYLIGTEKAGRNKIGGPQCRGCTQSEYCFRTNAPELTPQLQEKIEERFDDAKGHFVSHIIRYERGGGSRYIGGLFYNMYSPDGSAQDTKCSAQGQTGTSACFDSGWNAVRSLKGDIAERVKQDRITHIIVMSTGWNTLQKESIENYNDWIRNILAAAEEDGRHDFRPLFIGFSWASDWPWWQWLGAGDFVNKAHDADEVGLTWANVLIHEVLLPLKREADIPVVLIGHSFGARLLTRAIHSNAILPSIRQYDKPIDLFLGLQGAFSINRFMANKGKEGQPYRDFPRAAKKIILTSSKYDEAVMSALHTGDVFAGSSNAYAISQEASYTSIFEHTSIDAQGLWTKPPSSDSTKVTLIDASAMIKTNKEGTGGGAHSDVFDKETGRFIWQAIKLFGN